jgi:hypothetical protein
MVKDSKKYAATGGWGFGHFNNDGKRRIHEDLLSLPPEDSATRPGVHPLRALMLRIACEEPDSDRKEIENHKTVVAPQLRR